MVCVRRFSDRAAELTSRYFLPAHYFLVAPHFSNPSLSIRWSAGGVGSAPARRPPSLLHHPQPPPVSNNGRCSPVRGGVHLDNCVGINEEPACVFKSQRGLIYGRTLQINFASVQLVNDAVGVV